MLKLYNKNWIFSIEKPMFILSISTHCIYSFPCESHSAMHSSGSPKQRQRHHHSNGRRCYHGNFHLWWRFHLIRQWDENVSVQWNMVWDTTFLQYGLCSVFVYIVLTSSKLSPSSGPMRHVRLASLLSRYASLLIRETRCCNLPAVYVLV